RKHPNRWGSACRRQVVVQGDRVEMKQTQEAERESYAMQTLTSRGETRSSVRATHMPLCGIRPRYVALFTDRARSAVLVACGSTGFTRPNDPAVQATLDPALSRHYLAPSCVRNHRCSFSMPRTPTPVRSLRPCSGPTRGASSGG